MNRIIFGSNADDAKELPDARPTFIQLMNELILEGTRAGSEEFPDRNRQPSNQPHQERGAQARYRVEGAIAIDLELLRGL